MNTVELEITTMAHGGSGIGRNDGRVVFCPGVIPGEVVEAEVEGIGICKSPIIDEADLAVSRAAE